MNCDNLGSLTWQSSVTGVFAAVLSSNSICDLEFVFPVFALLRNVKIRETSAPSAGVTKSISKAVWFAQVGYPERKCWRLPEVYRGVPGTTWCFSLNLTAKRVGRAIFKTKSGFFFLLSIFSKGGKCGGDVISSREAGRWGRQRR